MDIKRDIAEIIGTQTIAIVEANTRAKIMLLRVDEVLAGLVSSGELSDETAKKIVSGVKNAPI